MKRSDGKIANYIHRGKVARDAHQAFKVAFAEGLREKNSDAYNSLLTAFRAATQLAYPSRYFATEDEPDKVAVDEAISFLAADAFFFDPVI